jgi:2-amino-4-hydroxy-6-hydroxymethyldihydropteridine diphosphokinase
MTTAYLALGSNIGDRLQNLREAATMLAAFAEIKIEARSKIYETQSVEGGGPDDFLNAVLRVSTPLTPRELMTIIRTVETRLGRPQPPRHGPRLIDIDILLFGDLQICEAELEIPHPRMHRRAFVLKPLLDVLEGGWTQVTNWNWNEENQQCSE